MDITEFFKKYQNEEACKIMFKLYRDRQGVICKKCGSREHYWQRTIEMYQCKKCSFRTTLRSGTVLESSKLPFHYWFLAMYFMTQTKKGVSANELKRQLGHKRYEPIWAMMHKIRAAMGNRDTDYTFDGLVEMDDAFFTASKKKSDSNKDKEQDQHSSRGRGSERQSKVLVMAKVESQKPGRPKKHKKSTAFRYVRMIAVGDLTADTINQTATEVIQKNTIIKTDGYRSYNKLKRISLKRKRHIVPPQQAGKVLPWVHTMISNAKRNFLGIYHKTTSSYLQNYLDEFCYKVNRRYFKDLFERLLNAMVKDTYYGKLVYVNG